MRVVIDDPRFDRWHSGLLKPGAEVSAHLSGNSRITLDVVDSEGAPVEKYSVALQRPVSREPMVLHFGDVPLENDTLDAIVAGRYDVIVRTHDMVGRVRDVRVEPGSKSQVDVVLQPWIGVTGSVAFPDGVSAGGVSVFLIRTAEVNDSQTSRIVSARAPFARPEHRLKLEETTTDSGGRFALQAPRSGMYVLMVAEENKTWALSDAFEIKSSHARHDLVLPRGAILSGHVRLPEMLPPSGWEVYFVREDFQLGADRHPSERPVLDANSSFEVTGLLPGKTRVFVRRVRDSVTTANDGIPIDSFEVGSVDLEEGGHHTASFALTDRVPSLVSIALTVDRDVEGATRAVFKPTEDPYPWSDLVVRGAGTKLQSCVLAAGEYDLHVEGDGWAILDLPRVHVPEGEALEIPIERELHQHRVRFFDDGKALAGGEISIWGRSRVLSKFQVGVNGWATITLNRGTVQVTRTNATVAHPDLERTSIVWPPKEQEIHLD